jgi:glutathione S-transferase
MTDLTLYSAEVCPYAQRTRILLGEKSIAHDLVEVDIDAKPAWFLDLTPTKRVPLIRHGDFLLWESATINEYLDATFPGPALRPTDERALATMRNEIRHFDNVFLPVVYKLLFAQEASEQDRLRSEVDEGMGFLESRLETIRGQDADGPFWMGSQLSLADLAMYPFFERLPVFHHYRGVTIPASCTRLRRWLDTLTERAAVEATAHDLDYFVPRYANYASGTAQGLSAQAFRSGAAN